MALQALDDCISLLAGSSRLCARARLRGLKRPRWMVQDRGSVCQVIPFELATRRVTTESERAGAIRPGPSIGFIASARRTA